MPELISPRDLIPMDMFKGEALAFDLVYADAAHPENIFGVAIYHEKSRLSLHKDFARIVLKTSRALKEKHGWTLVLKDGLRPIETQAGLMDTKIVRKNPQWVEGPVRLLSAPGQGAHPRGMAIDVGVLDESGKPVDMGTPFDGMNERSARAYQTLLPSILQDRLRLEEGFVQAAASLSLPLLPLPSEWWDFRFPGSYSGQYDPLSEKDLPPPLRMISPEPADEAWTDHFTRLAKDILLSI